MPQAFKEEFPEVAAMFDSYGHVNNLDMDKFKRQLQVEKWQRLRPSFKEDFQRVIRDRLITMEEHARLTDIDFETDDELFEYLQKIFDYLYKDGPYPVAYE